jgi:hypothetical protein
MTQIVLLDSTPVGLITNPKANPLDKRWKSLQASVTRYDDPFESAILIEDWDVLK